jgi:hypothetical protein
MLTVSGSVGFVIQFLKTAAIEILHQGSNVRCTFENFVIMCCDVMSVEDLWLESPEV